MEQKRCRRRARTWWLTVIAVATAGVLGACGGRSEPVAAPAGSPQAAAPSHQPVAAPAAPAVPAAPAAPASPVRPARPPQEPTALDDLAPFFAAAEAADARIREAASAINRGIGTSTVHIGRPAVEMIKASRPDAVAEAIPAGLEPDLQRAVLLVHSDLVARSAAFNWAWERASDTLSVTDPHVAHMLDALRQGSAIARRYPRDLAAARSLAGSSPPVRAVRADSRRAAELALHIAWIRLNNTGCGTSGGYVYTTPMPIVWKRIMADIGPFDGTIGSVRFGVNYGPGRGWQVELNAC